MRRVFSVLLVVMAGVGPAACGDDNKVGDRQLLDFKEQAQNRLGETTTTTAAPTTTTAPVTASTRPGAAGSPKPTSPTTVTTRPSTAASATTATTARKQQVATLEILINGDTSGQPPLDPQYARVFVGSIVRWVNQDTVARSVKADSGQFVSPPIPPGGTYDYKAITVGLFDYADDTRPYVKGTLEVLPS